MGYFGGRPGAFGVKENRPDPAGVDVKTGLVKYAVVSFNHFDKRGNIWNGLSFAEGLKARNNEEDVKGVVLFQLIEDRKLKIEAFPYVKPSQVAGFTDSAVVYVR